MNKTYTGSCHCGAVRYEVDLDFAAGTSKCNCSICRKTRAWSAIVKPAAFRLLEGERALGDYQFGGKNGHHLFCRNCGVRPFGRGYVEQIGGDYVSINVACLDNASDEELSAAPVRFMNGRDNDWFNKPRETRYL
ncbi:MAG TPA: GFA family protein [Gammaproteobacteria bacterium]